MLPFSNQSTLLLLPTSARAAVRDIDSAYRLIPLHPSQWPGVVLHDDHGHFFVDTCLGFGLSPAAGVWGQVADALADLLRRAGFGLVFKWVDDYIFISVPLSDMDSVNTLLSTRRSAITPHPHHVGGTTSFLFHGSTFISDDGQGHFVNHTQASSDNQLVTSLDSINFFSQPLGVPWKAAKDKDFASTQVYTGFVFDIPNRTVGLPEDKRLRYLDHITSWLHDNRHTSEDAEKLLGRLQHAAFVYIAGRKRLGYLRQFLRQCADKPRHAPRYPSKHLRSDLVWWRDTLLL